MVKGRPLYSDNLPSHQTNLSLAHAEVSRQTQKANERLVASPFLLLHKASPHFLFQIYVSVCSLLHSPDQKQITHSSVYLCTLTMKFPFAALYLLALGSLALDMVGVTVPSLPTRTDDLVTSTAQTDQSGRATPLAQSTSSPSIPPSMTITTTDAFQCLAKRGGICADGLMFCEPLGDCCPTGKMKKFSGSCEVSDN